MQDTLASSTLVANSGASTVRQQRPLFEVRFGSLHKPGRAMAFPCDDQGKVDLDALSESARNNYLYARATVGREHASPQICAA